MPTGNCTVRIQNNTKPSLPVGAGSSYQRVAGSTAHIVRVAGAVVVTMSAIFSPGSAYAQCDQVSCTIVPERRDHIVEQHCTSTCTTDNESKFEPIPQRCGNNGANLVATCTDIIGHPTCVQRVYTGGVIATADLGANIGDDRATRCGPTTKATVIYYTSTNPHQVWTMYPGLPRTEDLEALGPEITK